MKQASKFIVIEDHEKDIIVPKRRKVLLGTVDFILGDKLYIGNPQSNWCAGPFTIALLSYLTMHTVPKDIWTEQGYKNLTDALKKLNLSSGSPVTLVRWS